MLALLAAVAPAALAAEVSFDAGAVPTLESAGRSAAPDVAVLIAEQKARARRDLRERLDAVKASRAGILVDVRNGAALLAGHVAAFRDCRPFLTQDLPETDEKLVAVLAPVGAPAPGDAAVFTPAARREAPPEFRDCQAHLNGLRLYAGIVRDGQSRLREIDARAAEYARALGPAPAGSGR